ncbi:MAG: DegV family protein [Oscillospiraceae bacterium]|nr:DegV family protein [Oscillospiraceae bacterium]
MGIRIITDSSADFDLAAAKRRGVGVVPMSIQFGGASFVDGKSITHDLFYRLLQERKENPSTSQPSPADFLRVFEEAKAASEPAVVILLSGALSGTLQSAEVAKEMCGYDPIYIVDSMTATAGIQILVNYACKLRDSGLPAPEIAQAVENIKDKVRIFAVIDTLEYLRRGGRLTGLQAGLGAMARLKPVIAVRDGKVSIVGKALGTGAAVKQLMKLLTEHPVDDAYPSYFLYSDDKSREELLLPKLKGQNMLPLRLHYSSVGPTIGTHIGPGALGIAYTERMD